MVKSKEHTTPQKKKNLISASQKFLYVCRYMCLYMCAHMQANTYIYISRR